MEVAPLSLLKGLEEEISFVLNRIPFVIALIQESSAVLFPAKTTDSFDLGALLPAYISGVIQLTSHIRSVNDNITGEELEKAREQFRLVKKMEGQIYGMTE